jgi:hypothetical protein
MSRDFRRRISLKLAILIGLCICLWGFSGRAVLVQQDSQTVPITARQLAAVEGVIPVELGCGSASTPSLGKLDRFSCTLKNNTSKNILAANIAYSIILDYGSRQVEEPHIDTIDTFIHRDTYDAKKSLQPGKELFVGSAGPSFRLGAQIKEIRINVDYVEFEDGTTLGESPKASGIIADIRAGAVKYKKWLVKKYVEAGSSSDAIPQLLQEESAFSDVAFKNEYQEQGARTFQKRLSQIRETRGTPEVQKYLRK